MAPTKMAPTRSAPVARQMRLPAQRGQRAVNPPSITSSLPVTNFDSSEIR